MYNRKFNIKKDFEELNCMQNTVLPMLNEIKDQHKRDALKNYVRIIFFSQFKSDIKH